MKLLVLFLLSTSAFAASNESSFNLKTEAKKFFSTINDGLRVGIAQGNLHTDTRVRNASGIDLSARELTRTKIQLHAGYEYIRTKTFGYSVFGAYQDIDFDDEDVRNLRLSGNATYGFNPKTYAYGGLNYGKYYGSAQIENDFEAGMGYQLGTGYKINKKAIVELEYLALFNEGRTQQQNNFDLSAKGILLKLNTPFSINL